MLEHPSSLLTGGFRDMVPALKIHCVEEAIKQVEAKPVEERSRIEVEDLPKLKDLLAHLEENYVVKCRKCGDRVFVPMKPR